MNLNDDARLSEATAQHLDGLADAQRAAEDEEQELREYCQWILAPLAALPTAALAGIHEEIETSLNEGAINAIFDAAPETPHLRLQEQTKIAQEEVDRVLNPLIQEPAPPPAPQKRAVVVKNAARCKKCGDHIESKHCHDWVSCSCGAIFVDGGLDYLRHGGDLDAIEDLSVVRETTNE